MTDKDEMLVAAPKYWTVRARMPGGQVRYARYQPKNVIGWETSHLDWKGGVQTDMGLFHASGHSMDEAANIADALREQGWYGTLVLPDHRNVEIDIIPAWHESSVLAVVQ